MKIRIYYGSLAAFTEKLPDNYDSIVDLAIRDDEKHRKLKLDDGREHPVEELPYYENVVAFSDDYPALTESLIESFVSFIFRFDIDNLYLQNPPDSIAKYIEELSSAEHSIERQDYKVLDMDMLREIKQEFPNAIIGQSIAQRQTIGTLYDVAKGRFNKPCVMLFYGNTGIGKTETAKYIAEKLNERLFRKQFSMLHSEEFTSYLFGGKHNQNSFAKELLERESNVILLDEFDKPNPVFYSAFYQLFDEGVFADKNYTVTMKNAIIICTSNFLSEKQIRERLGDPIYSRFDAVIHFTDLQPDAIQKLLDREIERQYTKLDEVEQAIIDSEKIVPLLKQNAHRLSNARQIKKFVREAFSAAITDAVL